MRLILIGPQGSGKGTQGVRLCERLGVVHIATGDLLRAAVSEGTPLGEEAGQYMSRGELVPDGLMIEMLRERLQQDDAKAGFILDGFPRTTAQAEALGSMLEELGHSLDGVVSLEVPKELLIERMAARARADDTPEAIRRRLELFLSETAPVMGYYERRGLLVKVDGVGDIPEVERRIMNALEQA